MQNASDIDQYLNFTNTRKEEMACGNFYILFGINVKHIKKHGIT